MDDQRVGRIVRALRRRRGWRQLDLAHAANCSQNLVSLIERGHLDAVALRTIRRVLASVDASVSLDVRWRGAAIERLVDDAHAELVGAVGSRLRALGWVVEIEVTYSEFGERGSYDLVAWHGATSTLLVIEVKTDLPSAEATIRKLDEKTRLAAVVVSKRFGWKARSVARLLVLPETSTARARVSRHEQVFSSVFPRRNVAVRAWLAIPSGPMSGIWFFSDRDGRVAMPTKSAATRIRRTDSFHDNPPIGA